jgi:hypothetical protein
MLVLLDLCFVAFFVVSFFVHDAQEIILGAAIIFVKTAVEYNPTPYEWENNG